MLNHSLANKLNLMQKLRVGGEFHTSQNSRITVIFNKQSSEQFMTESEKYQTITKHFL